MADINGRITLPDALRGRFQKSQNESVETREEFVSDVKALFNSLEGLELIDAVIARIQRDAAEHLNLSVDGDFRGITVEDLGYIREVIRDKLRQFISYFILDEHREFMVHCHARGISTTDAVTDLISENDVMNRLAHNDALGLKLLRDILVHRLSYLKPGTARWPEKKYGDLWRETRATHKQLVTDIPLTSPAEQTAILVKLVERINDELDKEDHTVNDLQILTNSLTKTVESLRKVSTVEAQVPVDLSAPHLVAVLERLTLALDAPDQLAVSGGTDTLVAGLERLTHSLKSSGQKAIADGVESLPANTDTEDDDSD